MTQPLFAPVEADVVRVALPVPADELFEYSVPAELAARARPGCRVRVRFRERALTGVVVERGGTPQFAGPRRAVERVLDPEPVLSETMLSILREAAAEVGATIRIHEVVGTEADAAPHRPDLPAGGIEIRVLDEFGLPQDQAQSEVLRVGDRRVTLRFVGKEASEV